MKKIISSVMLIFITVTVIGIIVFVYQKYYFNDFIKAQEKESQTSFYRDSDVKTNDERSYCIESNEFNDAIFFKEIDVNKNTPYKVSCMVKTENVESSDPETSGACISLIDTYDQTIPVQGTNDWQKITLYFDSKNAEKVKIGFRLGGYDGYSKGKVWFSDIHVEEGKKDESRVWNVACFLIDNVQFEKDGKQYNYSLTEEDKNLLEINLNRFGNTCETFSNGAMKVEHEIIEITEPLTSFSYDEENYYYVSPTDVKPLIEKYVNEKEYDHIFIGIRMGNTEGSIPVKDWIGLGSMVYGNIGFSNIRMPNDMSRSKMYRYDIRNDIFPEEVFVHEFLHSLERNMKERGYDVPALHDNEVYGYKSIDSRGLKNWYIDYMQCNISTDNGKIGLDKSAFSTKPIQESDFVDAIELNFENNPENIKDLVVQVFQNFKNLIVKSNEENNENSEYNTIVTE